MTKLKAIIIEQILKTYKDIPSDIYNTIINKHIKSILVYKKTKVINAFIIFSLVICINIISVLDFEIFSNCFIINTLFIIMFIFISFYNYCNTRQKDIIINIIGEVGFTFQQYKKSLNHTVIDNADADLPQTNPPSINKEEYPSNVESAFKQVNE